MPLLSLDKAACQRDRHCVNACPRGLLAVDEDGYPMPTAEADDTCIDCGHCVAACPTLALSHAHLPNDAFLPVQESPAGAQGIDALIRNRRSVRNYKPQALPDELLQGLMETVRYAPTAINTRHVRWRVTKSPATTNKLAGLVAEWLTESGYAPQALQVWKDGGDQALRGAPHVAFCTAPDDYPFAWSDCSIATTMLDLAATARGLGTCWAGGFMHAARQHPALRAALALPEGVSVYGALMLGLPREHYLRVPPRMGELVTWID
ncbi:MAG: nitroreductase family protein [Pseudomonadota bacterium]